MSYKKILIAVDSSEFSMKAAKKGFELAHELNAKVALIFVVDVSKAIGNVEVGLMPETALLILKKEAMQTLDGLSTMYNGKELLKFMPEGHPSDDIIKTSKTFQADLIIIGTHGRTGLQHLLMGSVAENVIRQSKIPVMVVPSK